jgi:hypothetical protein
MVESRAMAVLTRAVSMLSLATSPVPREVGVELQATAPTAASRQTANILILRMEISFGSGDCIPAIPIPKVHAPGGRPPPGLLRG